MDINSIKNWFHRLSDLLEATEDTRWKQDGRLILALFAIALLTGPLCLLGWWIQRWNSTPSWDIDDHWDATKQAAITFAGVDILLVAAFFYVHPSLTTFWYLILWYGFCMLLAPTFALIAERIDPRTVAYQRVQLPSEQPTSPAAPKTPRSGVTVEEQQPDPPLRKKHSTTKKPTTPMTSKQELDKKLTKKMKKGRAVPLGDLLLQEKEERERKRTQINYVQAPLLPAEVEGVQPLPASTAAPKTEESTTPDVDTPSSTPTSEPHLPEKKPERRQPESLDYLF